MTFSWKLAVPVACVLVFCGAVITWQVVKTKANERELAEEARIARISAERGDAKAEVNLGTMYYHGQGLAQDYMEAVRWYRKAADQGDAKGQYYIGYMYDFGLGLSPDYGEALRWYRKAADQGDASAMFGVGSMYYYGRGLPPDRTEGARWFRLAADKGLAKAQYYVGYMYYRGETAPQNRDEAEKWYRKAADQGDERAQRALGLRGKGLRPWGVIFLSALFLACVFPLRSSLFPGQSDRLQQPRAWILGEILGVVWVGLNVYGAFGVFQSVFVAHIFIFIQSLVLGMIGANLIFVVGQKLTKVALCVSGILLIGANIFFVAHRDRWPLIAATRGLYSKEGLFLGIFIPLAVVVWLGQEKSRAQTS